MLQDNQEIVVDLYCSMQYNMKVQKKTREPASNRPAGNLSPAGKRQNAA
jgi:hypothetical protein